ncbi:FAD-binding oxidoreductase [Nitrospirillum iridis]|uniref:D-lactate dehydrogenase (cytochrome) n=1 Tax=Nitrospirillum iridis TaxID=765888 RepID=A0A7X0B707_9PROT|nr:FAD-linked oxidase C-terminal domain-containing protein [Nitrospirillum iridis]MBB6255324.1 D-lactate dehydrogenase (cytochrome) [Nitrospirillum iridis]
MAVTESLHEVERPAAFWSALAELLGDRLSRRAADREAHGHDESWHPAVPPEAVAHVRSTEEVAAVVRLCAAHGVPVIPFGAGTSFEGHVAALRGGVSLDFSGMNRILEVRPADMDVTLEPGVTREQLNVALRDHGLFFPIDPGASATLGGMASTRASGTNAVRYGTMRDVVLALTVVLGDGQVIRTGGRARKSSAGYDLTRLFVGSEGTLGVITELTIRLFGVPDTISAAVCSFPSAAHAVDTVITVIQSGVPVARAEFLDAQAIGAVNRRSGSTLAERPTLFFEFHGTAAAVAEQAELVQAIAVDHDSGPFEWATRAEDRSRLWKARHEAYWAIVGSRPGARGWPTDVCVPLSRLAEAVVAARADLDQLPFPAAIVGHVGDGNFHCVLAIEPGSPEEIAAAEWLNVRLVARALAAGGTCTGEHGIGFGKLPFMVAEHGPAIAVMRAIKTALDPAGLLNPGKVVPPVGAVAPDFSKFKDVL